ncbi:MAG: hypothetical protein QOK23_4257 [Gammaproteobacteria bacterium]|nr:hypothetical protein [Gammaproteobacteria bacterium]
MRRGIETVPGDGKVVILEDDASGTYELAHWSAQERAWIGENGKPIKIIPTHWHAMQRGADVLQEQRGLSGPSMSQAPIIFPLSSGGVQWRSAAPDVIASPSVTRPSPIDVVPIRLQDAPAKAQRTTQAARRFALSSIAVAMIASSLIGMYFRTEVTGYVTQYAGQHDILEIGTIGGQLVKQAIQFSIGDSHKADLVVRDAALPQQAEAQGGGAQTATWEAVQITKTIAAEATQLLEKERRRADVSEKEPAKFRPDGRNLELQAAAGPAQTLEPDRGQENAALVQALAAARQELTANEDKYRRALAEERDRGAAVASELATARQDVETQASLSRKTGDEAAQLKRASETATAELTQERERAKTLEGELLVARRDLEKQAALSREAGDEAHKQAAETAAAELQQARDGAKTLASELAMARRDLETQTALSRKTGDGAAQLKRAAETATAELQQARDKAKTLASELAMARRDLETKAALSRKAGDEVSQLKQAASSATANLQQERDRAQTLASELAMARRDLETQATLSKATDEAAQLKQAVETTSELQQSLQQERQRAKILESELAMARQDVVTQAALSRKASEEMAQLKQATKTASERQQKPGGAEARASEPPMARQEVGTQAALSDRINEVPPINFELGTARAELRRSPQERNRGEPTEGVKPTRHPTGARPVLEPAANSLTTKVGPAVAVAGAEQLATAEANGSLEVARLVERANALLGQGNIGAARIVLERAAEAGSAQATFRLAETYDPLVLSIWRTYGTRSDATKARELYAKAYDSGVKAAKDRSDALQTAGSEAK